MKRILVLGGSYFSGRVFIEELVKRQDTEIHVFNRGRVPLGIAGVIEHRGDREDPLQIRNNLPRLSWDAVVDFCAYIPEHVELILRQLPVDIGQYLLLSTTSVYRQGWELPLREDAPKVAARQTRLGSYADYGFDKWRTELALKRECDLRAIPHTVLRPAIIYGFYNYAPRERYLFELLQSNSPLVIPERGLPLFSFIFVVDLARMIAGCLGNEQAFNARFNVASDELISYPRLVEVLEKIAGRRLGVLRKTVDEIEAERIALPFPLDEHLIYSGAKLQQMLGFRFTPLAVGLRETYRYYLTVQQRVAERTTGKPGGDGERPGK